MINPDPNPKMFLVRTPQGKIYRVPEYNLDRAVQRPLNGEVLGEDDGSSNLSPPQQTQQPSLPSPQLQQQATSQAPSAQQQMPQEQMYRIKTPQGKIYKVPESNLAKAKALGGQLMQNIPDEYSGENPGAAFAKNVGAGAVGAIPDTGIALYNLTTGMGKPTHDPVTGEEFSPREPLPYVTDMISGAIDKATNNYTKDTGAKSKHAARFLGGLFGAGWAGKGIQAAGAAAGSNALEKTGSFVAKNLGVTNPSIANATGALASGASVGFAEDNELPLSFQVPLAIGSFILGHGVANQGTKMAKNSKLLEPLYKSIPGLQQIINKGHYKDLAKNVSPDSLSDLMKASLVENDTQFLTEKVLSELPEEITAKLKTNPASLTESEINTVISKGMDDYNNYISELESKYFPLTTGEATASPKIIAKEDSLANKPNVDVFDKAMKNRRLVMFQRMDKIKNDLGAMATDAEDVGSKMAKEVDQIYSDAKKFRADNWNKNFGAVVDKNILPIEEYFVKLNEFAKLDPDTLGNMVAIKSANRRLKALEGSMGVISPKRFNEILVGLNEEIQRFPDKTFSQKQIVELKKALENDLTKAIENSATAEQASLIRKARSDFAEDSKILNQLDDSILFNKINKDALQVPERIAQSLNNMPPSQLRLTFDALKRSENYQGMRKDIQSYYLNRAIEAATKNGKDEFNARIFLDTLPKKEAFNIIFDGSNAHQEIKDISVLLNRVKKFQPSRSNSKTAQRGQADRGDLEETAEMAINASNGDFVGLIKNFVGRLGNGNYDKKIAEMLVSPEHRKEMLKQLGQPVSSKKKAVFIRSALAPESEREKSKRQAKSLSRPNTSKESPKKTIPRAPYS